MSVRFGVVEPCDAPVVAVVKRERPVGLKQIYARHANIGFDEAQPLQRFVYRLVGGRLMRGLLDRDTQTPLTLESLASHSDDLDSFQDHLGAEREFRFFRRVFLDRADAGLIDIEHDGRAEAEIELAARASRCAVIGGRLYSIAPPPVLEAKIENWPERGDIAVAAKVGPCIPELDYPVLNSVENPTSRHCVYGLGPSVFFDPRIPVSTYLEALESHDPGIHQEDDGSVFHVDGDFPSVGDFCGGMTRKVLMACLDGALAEKKWESIPTRLRTRLAGLAEALEFGPRDDVAAFLDAARVVSFEMSDDFVRNGTLGVSIASQIRAFASVAEAAEVATRNLGAVTDDFGSMAP
jgi:hypothetical protein